MRVRAIKGGKDDNMGEGKKKMRYGGEIPGSVREIVCAHFRDYPRRKRLIAGAHRKGSYMINMQRYNRIVDKAISQVLLAHGISGQAAEIVRQDILEVSGGRTAKCVSGYGAMLSRGLYIAVREDALFFAAREFGLI